MPELDYNQAKSCLESVYDQWLASARDWADDSRTEALQQLYNELHKQASNATPARGLICRLAIGGLLAAILARQGHQEDDELET